MGAAPLECPMLRTFIAALRAQEVRSFEHPRGAAPTGPSNLNQKSILEDFDNFWRPMPTKWLQERPLLLKTTPGITLEGPCVDRASNEISTSNLAKISVDKMSLYEAILD